jgi:probable FeS assembly SUF system protein SufT
MAMQQRETVTLLRDVDAILVPHGTEIGLSEGTEFTITQSLGDTFTGVTDRGIMVRINGRDADAIGRDVPEAARPSDAPPPRTREEVEARVWDRLRTCFDPEIPVNIVDLGLIYSCEVFEDEGGVWRVEVSMTLTAPGCGMGEVLQVDAERKVREIPGVHHCRVEVVFDPPWSMDMMTEAARLQLGMA